MAQRLFAIGDIHGCDVALDVLLSKLAVTADDTVVLLGDVIDRGPGSRRVVEMLLQLQADCRLIFILGNHEQMLFEALEGGQAAPVWQRYGGKETLDSYGGRLELVPPEHIAFLRSGRDYWETDRDIFVHAGLDPDVPLERQTEERLRWTRISGLESPHVSGKRIICGHSTQHSGVPLILDGWVCIDTWVYGAGWLTALDVETNQVFQAQQQTARFRGGVTLEELR